MTVETQSLTFAAIDDLGFVAADRQIEITNLPVRYAPSALGPLLELLHLAACGRLPDPAAGSWLITNGTAPMISALKDNRESWLSSDHRFGFIRAVRTGADDQAQLTAFLMDALQAARDVAGLPGKTPGQLAGAMEELENNIHEHSGAAETGLLAFRAAKGVFEFVAADRGIGVTKSLRSCSAYADLSDHGDALSAALTDGTSRFGDTEPSRGHGFRPIFIGLMNLNGSLRFRSGDHALTMDGTSPTLATAHIAQKPEIDGFLASVATFANQQMS
jgi:anti-sigma regulatory factor (Ser/Thr protein kinase)